MCTQTHIHTSIRSKLRREQDKIRRIASSVMLHRADLELTDVSEELSACIIRVTRIGDLGTLAVTSNRRTLRNIP
jgi:hypothetical protein